MKCLDSLHYCVLVIIYIFPQATLTFSFSSTHGTHGRRCTQRPISRIFQQQGIDTPPKQRKTLQVIPSFITHEGIVSGDDSTNTNTKTTAAGKATLPESTFNLGKSIVGAGALSLPNGVAALSDDVTALLPASALCIVFGAVAAYSFSVIGKICDQTGSKTFQEAWERTVSKECGWIISLAVAGACFLSAVSYSIIIGDTFSCCLKALDAPASISGRESMIIILSGTVLLPLCMLRSLTALAPFSLLGLGGTLFTSLAMLLRLVDGSYAPGGEFYNSVPVFPRFGDSVNTVTAAAGTAAMQSTTAASTAVSESIALPSLAEQVDVDVEALTSTIATTATAFASTPLVLLAMLGTAFVAHYNAPGIYKEMEDASINRFNTVVYGGYFAATILYLLIMGVGFLTFGGASMGFVLNNYATTDNVITAARLALGVSILTGYPLDMMALRSALLDLFGFQQGTPEREGAKPPITIIGLLAITMLSLKMDNFGLIVGVSGALLGTTLMFIFPMIMNIEHIKKTNKNNRSISRRNPSEVPLSSNLDEFATDGIGAVVGDDDADDDGEIELLVNYVLIVMGAIMGVLGVGECVLKEMCGLPSLVA